MPESRDPMDEEGAVERMNAALRLQHRSIVAFSVVAGSLTGFAFQAFGDELAGFARAELEDARHLVEKIAALGRAPTTQIAPVTYEPDPEAALSRLVDEETEVIEALQAVIPHTGQEGRSEALEHRLEHMIMRKQEQVDALLRARRSPT